MLTKITYLINIQEFLLNYLKSSFHIISAFNGVVMATTAEDYASLAEAFATAELSEFKDSVESNLLYGVTCFGQSLYTTGSDNTVTEWKCDNESNVSTKWNWRIVRKIEGHTNSVLCVDVDDNLLVTGSSDSSIKIWDRETCECQHNLTEHPSSVLSLQIRGTRLVSAGKVASGSGGIIIVWNIQSDGCLLMAKLEKHKAAVNVVKFDYQFICSCSGDR